MGMLALTVDVGGIWLERRQLQNGADSTSLADMCARDATKCAPATAKATLDPLLDANAGSDNESQSDSRSDTVNGLCAREPSGVNFPGMGFATRPPRMRPSRTSPSARRCAAG